MPKFVILGAHAPVGQALADALDDRGLGASVVPATSLEFLRPPLELIEPSTLAGADLVFLAFDSDFSRTLAAGATRLEAPLVDLVGLLPRSTPLVFPVLDAGVGASLAGPTRVPLGLVGPSAAVLRAWAPFGLRAARVVTFEGVLGAGQEGIEALSEETRSVFGGSPAESGLYYGALAFEVATSLGDEDHPFDADDAFAADVRVGLKTPLPVLSVTRTRVPVFSGEGAALSVELDAPPENAGALIDALSATRGLRPAKTASPGTLAAVDRDDALYGRVRLQGDRADLWVSADRVRHGAALSAALVAESWRDAAASRT